MKCGKHLDYIMEPAVYLIRCILLIKQCKNRLEKEEISQPMSLHRGEHSRSDSKSEYFEEDTKTSRCFAFTRR